MMHLAWLNRSSQIRANGAFGCRVGRMIDAC
jgi:hypothetical protein